MNLEINNFVQNLQNNNLVESFLKELSNALENYDKKLSNDNNNLFKGIHNCYSIDEFIDKNFNFTQEQYFEFNRKKDEFLQNYFSNSEVNPDGNLFLVTNKYKNDTELYRYKLAQYKNNAEYKYVVSKNDLPDDIQLGDVVRKTNNQYIKDEQASQYVRKSIEEILKQILN